MCGEKINVHANNTNFVALANKLDTEFKQLYSLSTNFLPLGSSACWPFHSMTTKLPDRILQ
jgi:hypothetical protein